MDTHAIPRHTLLLPREARCCDACGGDGGFTIDRFDPGYGFGHYQTSEVCPDCDGEGVVYATRYGALEPRITYGVREILPPSPGRPALDLGAGCVFEAEPPLPARMGPEEPLCGHCARRVVGYPVRTTLPRPADMMRPLTCAACEGEF